MIAKIKGCTHERVTTPGHRAGVSVCCHTEHLSDLVYDSGQCRRKETGLVNAKQYITVFLSPCVDKVDLH